MDSTVCFINLFKTVLYFDEVERQNFRLNDRAMFTSNLIRSNEVYLTVSGIIDKLVKRGRLINRLVNKSCPASMDGQRHTNN